MPTLRFFGQKPTETYRTHNCQHRNSIIINYMLYSGALDSVRSRNCGCVECCGGVLLPSPENANTGCHHPGKISDKNCKSAFWHIFHSELSKIFC